jgi:hypothetical protein
MLTVERLQEAWMTVFDAEASCNDENKKALERARHILRTIQLNLVKDKYDQGEVKP